MLGVCAMIVGAILQVSYRDDLSSFGPPLADAQLVVQQWRVYETSPCGYYATDCDSVSAISLWWQIPLISLPACGELFVNVTSYEIAYTKAPQNMRGLVYAVSLRITVRIHLGRLANGTSLS
jgi:hypothetical protein